MDSKAKKNRPFQIFLDQFSLAELISMSWPSLVYRAVVLLLSLLGCVYQVYGFLHLYFEYPTTVDTTIQYPEAVEAPGFTICNENAYRRTEFCRLDPDNCRLTTRGEEICEEDPVLCQNLTYMSYYMIPELDVLEFEVGVGTIKPLLKYAHKAAKTVPSCYASWAPEVNLCGPEYTVSHHFYSVFDVVGACFTYNTVLARPNQTAYIPLSSGNNYITLVVDSEPHEYFQPFRAVKTYIAIHSPYELSPRLPMSQDLTPGRAYTIYISMSMIRSLPPPYPSNCTDHYSLWLSNKESIAASQKECISMCQIALLRDNCNCFPIYVSLPWEKIGLDEIFCEKKGDPDYCMNKLDVSGCEKECSIDCKQIIATTQVLETSFDDPPLDDRPVDPKFNVSSIGISEEDIGGSFLPMDLLERPYFNLFTKDRFNLVTLRMKKQELLVYNFKPKFQLIEVFSYLGGYVGVWLGFSLVELNDLLLVFSGFIFKLITERKMMAELEIKD